MSITIKQNLVPKSKYNIKCPYSMKAEFITVHNTYNDASAENEIKYMISNNNQVSYHFAVDGIGAVQGLPLDRNGWHCGDGNGKGNRASIGVEICYSKSGGERYVKAEENAVKLIARLLKERNWGIDRVKQHYDWSKKNCPHRIRAEGRWNSFLERIKKEMEPKSEIKEIIKEVEKEMNQPLFSPSTNTFKNEFVTFLENAHKKGILSSNAWAEKAKSGSLSQDDAIALVVTIINRSK